MDGGQLVADKSAFWLGLEGEVANQSDILLFLLPTYMIDTRWTDHMVGKRVVYLELCVRHLTTK